MFSYLVWDPDPVAFSLPLVGAIRWYGIFFALGFLLGFPLAVSTFSRLVPSWSREEVKKWVDSLSLSLFIGLFLGARLGHFLFYEKPSFYLNKPWRLFWIREGGLASHGAVVGVILALFFFYRRRKSSSRDVPPFLSLLDGLVPSACLIAFTIRIGNFFNQEIVGLPSDLPWAILFLHSAEGVSLVPRHPTQLYEALFYLGLFFFFWKVSYWERWLRTPGRLSGLLLTWVFLFRIFVEHFKLEQSHLFSGDSTVGQWLSLPLLGFGIWLLYGSLRRRS